MTMEADNGRLSFEPLGEGEARILRFHGFKNGIIYCRTQLTHHGTSESATVNLTYHAISYVWGDADDHLNFSPIICNGVRVYVPNNLHAAMVEIWQNQPLLKLWADAVCIDQHDAEEKSRQVALMYRIFRDAACVQVWLGQDDQQTADTLRYLILLGRKNRFSRIDSIKAPTLQQFDHFLAHPWSSRAWTMQEVSLARRALFRVGSYTADRDAIHEAMSHHTSVFVDHERGLKIACGLGYSHLRETSSLLQTMMEIWPRDAHDPRDKVFAIRGMFSNLLGRLDYSLSLAEVYIDAAMDCINECENLIYSHVRDSLISARTTGMWLFCLPGCPIGALTHFDNRLSTLLFVTSRGPILLWTSLMATSGPLLADWDR